eukprot:scaffold6897_cov161-Prasinococcus_capsulatus_cf.AAC.1
MTRLASSRAAAAAGRGNLRALLGSQDEGRAAGALSAHTCAPQAGKPRDARWRTPQAWARRWRRVHSRRLTTAAWKSSTPA